MLIRGYITGIQYQHFLYKKLNTYTYSDLDINLVDSTFLLSYGEYTSFAICKWVSPKRTRSYPYARVYDILSSSNRKIAIIPIIKDEGCNGDRDYIQWDTVSLMSLLDVFVIFAYYSDAEINKNNNKKITNQKLDNDFIKHKINEIASYRSSALHWNLQELNDKNLHKLIENVKTSYHCIHQKTGVPMHSDAGIDFFKRKITSDIDLFMDFSRGKAKEAQHRESLTIQPKELLSSNTKAKITINNYLGGEYFFTVDEVKLIDDEVHLIESKHSTSSRLPSDSDIKDGLLKLVLYSNLKNVNVDDVAVKSKPVLKLTSYKLVGSIDNYSDEELLNEFCDKNKLSLDKILVLFREAKKNNIKIIIGD